MRLSFTLALLILLVLFSCGGSQDEPVLLPPSGTPGSDSFTDNLFVEGYVQVPDEKYLESARLILKEVYSPSDDKQETILQMDQIPLDADGHFKGSMRLSRGYARLVAEDSTGTINPDSLDLVPFGYYPGINWNMKTFKASFQSVLVLGRP